MVKAEENYWPISVFLENLWVHIGELEYAKSGLSGERSWDVRIDGWRRIHWSDIQQQDWSTCGSENPLDVIEVLRSEVASSYPDAKVSFVEISFDMSDVLQKMFDNLGIPPLSQEELRKEKKKRRFQALLQRNYVKPVTQMSAMPSLKKLHELETLLFVIGFEEPDEEMKGVLPNLIEMQNMAEVMESDSTIVELVMNRYSISADELNKRCYLFYGETHPNDADAA
eukprot:scaffold47138_cov38-Cyclotella_meneghiniana.AAC.1